LKHFKKRLRPEKQFLMAGHILIEQRVDYAAPLPGHEHFHAAARFLFEHEPCRDYFGFIEHQHALGRQVAGEIPKRIKDSFLCLAVIDQKAGRFARLGWRERDQIFR
jgi:hypothetical protein